jgi:hypothetical protein
VHRCIPLQLFPLGFSILDRFSGTGVVGQRPYSVLGSVAEVTPISGELFDPVDNMYSHGVWTRPFSELEMNAKPEMTSNPKERDRAGTIIAPETSPHLIDVSEVLALSDTSVSS